MLVVPGRGVGGDEGLSSSPSLPSKLCACTLHLQPLAGKSDTLIQNK